MARPWWAVTDQMRSELEAQIVRLLEEAERPMRVEEILPHLHPVMPTPNDVADVLGDLMQRGEAERDGSFFSRLTPVPVDHLFGRSAPVHRDAAEIVVALIRELDSATGEGAPYPALFQAAARKGVPRERVIDIVTRLKHAGEAFSPRSDALRLAKG